MSLSTAEEHAANRERMARESDAIMCDMFGLDATAELDAAGSLTDERRIELARELRNGSAPGGDAFYRCFFAQRYESLFAAEEAERDRLRRQRRDNYEEAWYAAQAARRTD